MIDNILPNVFIIQGGLIHNNTYIIKNNDFAFIIDPSYNLKEIKNILEKNNITNIDILLTHFHYDHIGNSSLLLEEFKDSKIYIGSQERKYVGYEHSDELVKILDNEKESIVFLDESDFFIEKNGLKIRCIHTPAHTMGSYTFVYENIFFTGDFIFFDTIGFLDDDKNSANLFKKSLNKLLTLFNDDSLICSGHDSIGTWSESIKVNEEIKTYGGLKK